MNPFGGKNKHGMYVPMTDLEMEVIARLADAGEFSLVIRDWGLVSGFRRSRGEQYTGTPLIILGDKRVSFYFPLAFSAPDVPQPNYYFDIEVWAAGHMMSSHRMPTEVNGNPIQIAAGVVFHYALDVAIHQIDPNFVKQIKPAAVGLTTRHGNMHLDVAHQRLLQQVREGERTVRSVTAQEARAATKKSGER